MEKLYSQRVADITKQPVFANFVVIVGDKILTTNPPRPNIFQSFEFNKLENAGSSATFTIFDDNWDEIEELLAKYYNQVYIQYGYPGNPEKTSPVYRMMLADYSISFNSTGSFLVVNALSLGVVDNLDKISLTTSTKNPTEAAKTICRSVGWLVLEENFDASLDVDLANEESYNLNNENPATYILDVLIPAAAANGETFYFYLDDTQDPHVAYFKKRVYNQSEAINTYVYQKGYDSVVIDLTFVIKGIFGGTSNFLTVTGLTSEVIDPITKEVHHLSEDLDSVRTSVTGEYSHTKSGQSVVNVGSSGMSRDQVSAILKYRIKNASDRIYEATMTIVGDPTINLLDTLRIINVTDSGNLHHTSGLYMVTGITTSITGGNMTTILKLVRNGDIQNGVELMNYKHLIK